jgi:excisionase family DNA binding protein
VARTAVAKNPAATDTADTDSALQSVPQTARDLGLKDRQTYNLVASGKIPSLRAGGTILVPKSFVVSVLARLERGETVVL